MKEKAKHTSQLVPFVSRLLELATPELQEGRQRRREEGQGPVAEEIEDEHASAVLLRRAAPVEQREERVVRVDEPHSGENGRPFVLIDEVSLHGPLDEGEVWGP